MKGNVFSQWLKEFCALVFTQAVQAFLLAIILSMVVLLLTQDSGTNSVTTNQAAGVLAIIALASISKMEELIKKLFGISSSITDTSMRGGKGGVLGTIMAMQMAKKALNNAPKVAQGVSGRVKARGDIKKAELAREKALNRARDRFEELHGINPANTSSSTPATSANNAGSSTGGSSGAGSNTSSSTESTSSGGSNTSTNTRMDEKLIRDKHKLQDEIGKIEEEYTKKIQEANKNKRTANRNIVSGITETSGAFMGAAAGAVYGLGTGDDVLKSAGVGIGVGDTIGKYTVDIPSKMNDIKNEYKELHKNTKAYSSELKRKNDELVEKMKNFNASDI